MDKVAVAFWGAYFGTVALMLAASLAAYVRSMQYVALMAGLSALMSGLFVVAYLGWLPVEAATAQRLQAHVAVGATVMLGLMLLSLLGLLRRREVARRAYAVMFMAGGIVLALGWLLGALESLVLASLFAVGVGVVNLGLTVRGALRGDRLARVAVVGVFVMLVATAGLSWIAVKGGAPWPLHATSAVAGIVYLATMATALWARYSYLLELSEVLAHGPSYDPVTRMRSHRETGQLVGNMFFGRDAVGTPLGVIAVTIANLRALENLHGRAAFNHALFICAGRLRRHVPTGVEMGRLGEDGFLLLLHDARDTQRLVRLARLVRERLARPVVLSTSRAPAELEAGRTEWVADVGVGVLAAGAQLRPSQAVAAARSMSLTAWSYPSRLAWLAPGGEITELRADAG
ncbi:MAG TPA: GGDEF domain-containing protein [Ramlibacter sp.]|jgi:GGDEF domain-containing protein|nr:GGDEF domain-containing protein [Ramlibacter sp.]